MCAPKAPSATNTAAAQTSSNIGTALSQAYLNQPNQNTPWGSVSSSVTGNNAVTGPDGKTYNIPQFTQNTTLSPGQQQLFDTTQKTQQGIANIANGQLDKLGAQLGQSVYNPQYQQFGGAPKLQTGVGSGGAIQKQIANAGQIQTSLGGQDTWGRVQDVENALFQRYNPQLEQDRQRMEQQLANQGVRVGSTAWNTAMDAQNRNVNDARLGITINAGQEQNRLQQLDLNSGNFANSAQAQQYGQNANNAQFANSAQAQQYGQNLSSAQFANGANQQMFQNGMAVTQGNNGLQDSQLANDVVRRNQLLNEQSSLMSGGQVAPPQFGNTPQTSVGGTDVAGLINGQYQQQLASNNNMWGGIGQAAGAALPFVLSDRRAKKDIKKLGSMAKGVGIYSYTYKGDDKPQIGVMAQEAEKVVPSAVRTRPDGYKEVNYPRLTMALGAK